MTTRSAVLVALMPVLPGVVLRVVPCVERLVQARQSRDVAAPAPVPAASVFELVAPLVLLSRSFRRLWFLFPPILHIRSAVVIGRPFLIAYDRVREPRAR